MNLKKLKDAGFLENGRVSVEYPWYVVRFNYDKIPDFVPLSFIEEVSVHIQTFFIAIYGSAAQIKKFAEKYSVELDLTEINAIKKDIEVLAEEVIYRDGPAFFIHNTSNPSIEVVVGTIGKMYLLEPALLDNIEKDFGRDIRNYTLEYLMRDRYKLPVRIYRILQKIFWEEFCT